MTTEIYVPAGDQIIKLNSAFAPAVKTAPYEVYALRASDLDAFLDLQAIGQIEAIQSGNPYHLKPRGHADLKAHIQAGMSIVGVRHAGSGEHVAQLVLTDPVNPAAVNLAGYPLAMGDRAVQSFYIHPEHRFSKLEPATRKTCNPARLAFNEAARLSAQDSGIRLVAKIADDNGASLKSFARNGFSEIGVGLDPARGYAVRYYAATIAPVVAIQPSIEGDRMDAPCPA